MRAARLLRTASVLLLVAWLIQACSPALNWREVQLSSLKAMLPCKPDRAQRNVLLGKQDLSMAMAGCEASGALYAVSHVRVASTALVGAAQADWREAMLANFQTQTVQKEVYQMARRSIAGGRPASSPSGDMPNTGLEILSVQGTGADGGRLQARLLWLAQGPDIYHVAIYAPELKADQFDMLFSELALQ